VGAHDGDMGGLPQRLQRDGGEPRLDTVGERARRGQASARLLERVQAPLADALAVHDEPIVVPAEQQLTGLAQREDVTGAGGASSSISRRVTSTKRATSVRTHGARATCVALTSSSCARSWMRYSVDPGPTRPSPRSHRPQRAGDERAQ